MNECPTSVILSILIPAYNEEAVIVATVGGLMEALRHTGWSFEIVVADDGSTDQTWSILEALEEKYPCFRAVRNEGPGGYGMAVKAAINASFGDTVIVAMANGSDPPEDVVEYGRAMIEEGFDCAFGTRFTNPGRVSGYTPVKRVFNRMGNWLISCFIRCNYDDFTNGFKGYRREILNRIQPLVSADFNLTIEMSIKAVLSGARFAVIENGWRDRSGGES